MSAHAYTEDQLVEQPAKAGGPPSPWSSPSGRRDVGLFAELGWTTVSAMEETFGSAGTLQRETKGEVILVPRLRSGLERLNPALPPEAITVSGLIEWLVAGCCKSLLSRRFLFE